MLIRRVRGWEMPESRATSETVFLSRRSLVAGGLGALAGAAVGQAGPPEAPAGAPSRDGPVTPEAASADHGRFYEFSQSHLVKAAEALRTDPWTIAVDGLVERPFRIAFEDLLRMAPIEERVYRHRCVEAWALAVPWTGFPLRTLLDLAKPLGSARYVRMQSFLDRSAAPAQRQGWYPWPYAEALTLPEAAHELAFLVTGAYGRLLPKRFGAPLRLAVPWKYGFKSAKSLVRFSFVEARPKGFWETVQPAEYGFWANVNPAVSHPRWSQAEERLLGRDVLRPSVIFNGYGELVAGLYAGLDPVRERLFV